MKKILTTLTLLLVAASSMVLIFLNNSVFAKNQKEEVGYEIYPTPQEITYSENSVELKEEVNVVYSSSIDEYTEARTQEVLDPVGNVTVSDTKVDSKLNVYVFDKDDQDENVVNILKTYEEDLNEVDFENKIDPYFIKVANNEILIVGDTTNSAFYGVTTLGHILDQVDNSILELTLFDYADTATRGFIEGYYGVPWSIEDRASLMKFGGEFKMTSYIFAPKDDPYHKDKWRVNYPSKNDPDYKEGEPTIEDMEYLAQVGLESKCRFVWTAHPFMGGFNQQDAANEIEKLISKFEQLYSVGVRQFGVLGDDVGNLPRTIVVQMMKRVSEWCLEKTRENPEDPVYDPVFCPQGYNHSWQGNYQELNQLDREFPENVQIFWTGESVCKPVEQITLDHFRTHALPSDYPKDKRRAPLFWLNWPVNDVNHARMVMGKGQQLKTDVNPEDLVGVVTNPMQEAEASKVALFAVSDYAWNIEGFNMDKSWADGFKYIEPDATEELHTIAKHMSDPAPNGHGLVQDESEELKPYLDKYNDALAENNITKINEAKVELIEQLEIIINACNDFHVKSKNANLKDELLPYTESLKDLCLGIIDFLNAKENLILGNQTKALTLYLSGSNYLESSKNHTKPTLSGRLAVEPSAKRIIPFINNLKNSMSDQIAAFVGGETVKPTYSINMKNGFGAYEGKLENIYDGNLNTKLWTNQTFSNGDYIEVTFAKPTDIYGINLYQGTVGQDAKNDIIDRVKFKVFTVDNPDGILTSEYTNLKDIHHYQTFKNVTRIQAVSQSNTNKWLIIREFSFDYDPVEPVVNATASAIDAWVASDLSPITDNNPNTQVQFAVRNDITGDTRDNMLVGDYLQLDLGSQVNIGTITLLMAASGDDYAKNYDLEYSLNGTDWTKLGSYTDRETRLDFTQDSENRQARYVRLLVTKQQHNWIIVRDFIVTAKLDFNSSAYTNNEELKDVQALVLSSKASLEATESITLNANEYIGLELKQMSYIKSLTKNIELAQTRSLTREEALVVEVSPNGITWETYQEDARQNTKFVRLINKSGSSVSFNLNELTVSILNYEAPHEESKTGFNGYEGDFNALFDGDRTTRLSIQSNQTQGNNLIIDLGREINFETLKLVLRDSEHDFLRHGKVSLSLDNVSYSDVLYIGSQDSANPGEANNSDTISDVFPLHETSYYCLEAKDINMKARFLKIEVTRTKEGANKWTAFNEIEINGGYYFNSLDGRFMTETTPERNYDLGNMVDNDLSTAFKANEQNSDFIYYFDKVENLKQIKIILLNKLEVAPTVYVLTESNGVVEELKLGNLTEQYTNLDLPQGKNVLGVRVAWTTKIPTIAEIVSFDTYSFEEINYLLENELDTSKWFSSDREEYNSLLEEASSLLENATSQKAINDLASKINDVIANHKVIADFTTLYALLNNKVDTSNWTSESKAEYDALIKEAEALVKSEVVQAEADLLVEKITAAIDNHKEVEVTLDKEELNELLNESLVENQYTEASLKAYKDVIARINEELKYHGLTQDDIDGFVEEIKEAKANLVLKDNTTTPQKPEPETPETPEEGSTTKGNSLEATTALIMCIFVPLLVVAIFVGIKAIKKKN